MVKVSIIIPVYNVENYLRECLDSAVNQTLDSIEIICVNDGSTDSSGDILKEYEEKYDNLKVINQKNKGLGGARNTGLDNASGEYIYFLDSDDYINSDMAERCYTTAKLNDLDIVILDCRVFYENEEYRIDYIDTYGCLGKKIYNGVDAFNNIKKYKGNNWWSVWTQFYRKRFIDNVNIKFDENVFYEDIYYGTKMILGADRVSHVGRILYNYRRRMGSITNITTNEKHIDGYICAIKSLIRLYDDLEKDKEKCTLENLKQHINYFIKLFINECIKQSKTIKLKELNGYLIKSNLMNDIEQSILIDTPMLFKNIFK